MSNSMKHRVDSNSTLYAGYDVDPAKGWSKHERKRLVNRMADMLATKFSSCPHCKATQHARCETTSGKPSTNAHRARVVATAKIITAAFKPENMFAAPLDESYRTVYPADKRVAFTEKQDNMHAASAFNCREWTIRLSFQSYNCQGPENERKKRIQCSYQVVGKTCQFFGSGTTYLTANYPQDSLREVVISALGFDEAWVYEDKTVEAPVGATPFPSSGEVAEFIVARRHKLSLGDACNLGNVYGYHSKLLRKMLPDQMLSASDHDVSCTIIAESLHERCLNDLANTSPNGEDQMRGTINIFSATYEQLRTTISGLYVKNIAQYGEHVEFGGTLRHVTMEERRALYAGKLVGGRDIVNGNPTIVISDTVGAKEYTIDKAAGLLNSRAKSMSDTYKTSARRQWDTYCTPKVGFPNSSGDVVKYAAR